MERRKGSEGFRARGWGWLRPAGLGLAVAAGLQAGFPAAAAEPVICEGEYPRHLQGVCIDADRNIHWSFTTRMVKTDPKGKKLLEIEVPNHHGDLCHRDGRIYVAVNLGLFNDPRERADSWVYVYDTDLELLAKHRTPQVVYGAGGMDHHDGRFFVIGGLPGDHEQNYVYEYDEEFQFRKRHEIDSGQTHLGIQTADFADGHWWFGCYGSPKVLLKTDADFRMKGKYVFDCAYGIVNVGRDRFLVARGPCGDGACRGSLHPARPQEENGLEILKP